MFRARTGHLKKQWHGLVLCVACAAVVSCASRQTSAPGARAASAGKMAFTISMDDPVSHLFHVTFRCEGLEGKSHDFKMPVWSPGYYGVFDFAANVQAFRAEDDAGHPLEWSKTAASTWTVQSGRATTLVLHYDVKATSRFVANSYLDETRGYIVATGVCLYVDDLIQHPVTVTLQPYPKWSTIATGLDRAGPDQPHTYAAPNFDVLYDSPILMGNLDALPPFKIRGVPHYFIGYQLGTFDSQVFTRELQSVLEAGIAVIGEIPYPHYTFIGIGPGQGGIEHLNSATIPFSGTGLDDPKKRAETLGFLAHEYFHNYNVKRIRPVALGPFAYDKPNLTNMLWVSEGFTVYYEYLMLVRAGVITPEQFLEHMSRSIAAQENNTGRFFQSATESSYGTWTQGPFGGGRGGLRKTISYYDKGAILGFLLDLQIRHETQNRRSLDDVMRTLYRTYYQQKQRGFTDEEFRAVCESVAGCPLPEIVAYAATTVAIDYPKYLSYAGLEFESPKELAEAYLGIIAEDQDGKLVAAAVEGDSPAQQAGVKALDEIKTVAGGAVNAKGLRDLIASQQPGARLTLTLSRAPQDREVEVVLTHRQERSFHMKPVSHPDSLQASILKSLTENQATSKP